MPETHNLEKNEDIQSLYLICDELNNLAAELEILDATLKRNNSILKKYQKKKTKTTTTTWSSYDTKINLS